MRNWVESLPPKSAAGAAVALLIALVGACSQYEPFDSAAHLRQLYARQLGETQAGEVAIPWELSHEIVDQIIGRLSPTGNERDRTRAILDFVFSTGGLDLRYALSPTRSAIETYYAREGNCLSFVNLFVGIGRMLRLNPGYVEVRDHQRWSYRDGVVLSQGHIVAGMEVDGQLSTFDFLPYRPKSYRDFRPIDDLTATAHFYNNLGAESLLSGDFERAETLLTRAVGLAPDFDKAVNNLGVLHLRQGRIDAAVELYDRGLARDPQNVAMLTNKARALQLMGNKQEGMELLATIEETRQTSVYFFIYRAEMAMAEGDPTTALKELRKALRRDSEVPEVHVGLAKVYLALGELDKARHHLERALKLDATHRDARALAAMLARARSD